MKGLEELLKNVPKPQLQPESFRRELRRELRVAQRVKSARIKPVMRFGWILASIMTLAICTFVLNPAVPARINSWLIGSNEDAIRASSFQSPFNGEREGIKALSVSSHQGLNPELTSDQSNLNLQIEQLMRLYPGQIQEIEPPQTIRIHEYLLPDGRRIQVYTRDTSRSNSENMLEEAIAF